jgi:hypothetical protein
MVALCFAALLFACGAWGAGRDGAAAQRRRRPAKGRAVVRVKENRVAEGLWGGAHLRLSVSRDGAALEFDCASGQVGAPFETDARGRFDQPGTYTRQGPGPIRIGREPTARPARYSGRVEGDRMTLAVRLEGSDRPLGEYTLTRGDRGQVMKCR